MGGEESLGRSFLAFLVTPSSTGIRHKKREGPKLDLSGHNIGDSGVVFHLRITTKQ